jgi:hypothetical protein
MLTSSSALEHDFVIQTQPQLRHARQVTLHLDRPEDLRPDDVSVGVDLQRKEETDELARRGSVGYERDIGWGNRLTRRLTLSMTSRKTSFFR